MVFIVLDAYVPHGYVTFNRDDTVVLTPDQISYREVTSPINPEDFHNSRCKGRFKGCV